MTMERLYGFEPDPRDIAEDAEDLARPGPSILEIVFKHRGIAFGPEETRCACDRTWRTHMNHIVHLSNAVRAHVAGGGAL